MVNDMDFSTIEITVFVVGYISGSILACGYIGGIRDEMDGILDQFIVFCWPIALFCKIIWMAGTALYKLGEKMKSITR